MDEQNPVNQADARPANPPADLPIDEAPAFRVIDRRHFYDLEGSPGPEQVPDKPRYPSFVEELLARVADTERRFAEKKKQIDDELRRIRERLESDLQRKLLVEKQKFLLPFLEVLDNLQRALQAAPCEKDGSGLAAGIRMIAGQFEASMQALGVESLHLLHQPFDPRLSQAVGVQSVSDPALDGVVVEELLRGYRLGDQLMRPAQVLVGRMEKTGSE